MKLQDCTRDELIFIIDQFKLHSLSSGEYYLTQALNDVELKRQEKMFAEADRLAGLAYQKRMEYIDLLSPYEGVPIIDVPLEVMDEAAVLLKEAQALGRKANRLLGIRLDAEEGTV